MKDFLNNPLAVEDQVIFVESGYRSYNIATIVRFTPQKVVIEWTDRKGYRHTLLQEPKQLIKIKGVNNHATN